MGGVRLKLSICNFSFQKTFLEGKMDIFGYLETVKYRYGMNKVDLWNGFFTKKEGPLWILPDESYIKKIRNALDEKEMRIVNFAIDGAHVWDPDSDIRRQLHDNALQHFRAAEILGAQTVRIDTGGRFGSDPNFDSSMTNEQFEYIVSRYQEYSERAANNGYMIGPENHTGPSLDPMHVKKIAEAVNHPNFGVLLHMNRWKAHEEEGDEIVAPWVYHTHFDAKMATAVYAEDKLQMLLDKGYDGYWGLEYNAPKNQYIEMEWLIATVKRLLVSLED